VNASVVLLDKVSRATVGVHTSVPSTHVSAALGLGTERRGTGVLISADGLILSVYYVLMGASNAIVTLVNGDQYEARIVAQDYNTGLGLLKIEGTGFDPLAVVSSEGCTVGQEVFVISSVGGQARCADSGMISYLGPFDAMWEFVLEHSVCATALALNLGFNGGPICNSRGEMVALSYLNFADISRSVLGVPGEYFLMARDELVRCGKRLSAEPRTWMGVLSYTLREHVVIAGVMPESPCEKAGLRQGDVVLSADGREISERRALYQAVQSHRPGELLNLKVLRENRVRQIAVPVIKVEDYFG
jgi:S1-C subfamily serine protease